MGSLIRAVSPLTRTGPCRDFKRCAQSFSGQYGRRVIGDSALLAELASISSQGEFAQGEEVLDSVVKIYVVSSRPNFFSPWQNHSKRETTGSGFVISPRLILTNAHVVGDATFIQVKRHGSGTKYKAEVQAIGHEVDLAIISVDDKEFWTSPTEILPLELSSGVPELQSEVQVVGEREASNYKVSQTSPEFKCHRFSSRWR